MGFPISQALQEFEIWEGMDLSALQKAARQSSWYLQLRFPFSFAIACGSVYECINNSHMLGSDQQLQPVVMCPNARQYFRPGDPSAYEPGRLARLDIGYAA